MMQAILKALKTMAVKPQSILPALLMGLIQLGILYFTLDFILAFLDTLLVQGSLARAESMITLYQAYAAEFNLLLLLAFAFTALNFITLLTLGHLSKGMTQGKASITSSLGFAVARIGRIIGTLVFLFLAGVILYAAFTLALGIASVNATLGTITLILFAIITLIVYVKLALFPVIMGAEDLHLKDALVTAWQYSQKRSWGILLLLIVLAIITSLIDSLGLLVSESITSDLTAFTVIILLNVIAGTFTGLALSYYYVLGKKSKPLTYTPYARRKRRK